MVALSDFDDFRYSGRELALAEQAICWQAYYSSWLRPYLRGRVLEVGAGLGTTTRLLYDEQTTDWLCLEPDAVQAHSLRSRQAQGLLPARLRLQVGTLETLPATEGLFDTILYVNVLEHIAEDAAEMRQAYARLAPGGFLLVLVPAHQWLFSRFDSAIGHFRRYARPELRRVLPAGGRVHQLAYLDSLGLLAAAASKLVGQTYPTIGQVKLWDRGLVPLSRWLDPLLGHTLGKSVVAVVEKPGA